MLSFLSWSKLNADYAQAFSISEFTPEYSIEKAFEKRIVWIETGSNLGFAGGSNVGVRFAQRFGDYEFFWFLNNDCEVAPDALDAYLAYMASRSDVGICGAQLRYFHFPQTIQAYAGAVHNVWTGRARYIGYMADVGAVHDQNLVEHTMSYVCGASMFVRRDFIETVGLMQEDYFLYYEEIDWAIRGQGLFNMGYAPGAVVFHKEGATIGSNNDPKKATYLSEFYLFRNRLLFTKRFFPYALCFVWITMLCQAVKRSACCQFERAWLIFKILFGKKKI
jgi:GT2 family glycosyltransferase